MHTAIRTGRRARVALKVERIGGRQWRFVYPRLYAELMGRVHKALELYDAGQLPRAERMLRTSLAELPEHLDALHHLALFKREQGALGVAATIWEEAVRLGRAAFPGSFEPGRDRLEWRWADNRPYLRCLRGLASASCDEGDPRAALTTCRELLALNPADEPGARALAIESLLTLGRPGDVVRLCEKYPGDYLADARYGLALAWFQLGDRSKAARALRAALAHAPLSDRLARFWDSTDGAVPWLREVTGVPAE